MKKNNILIEIPDDFQQIDLLIEHINRLLYVFGLDVEPEEFDEPATPDGFLSELEEEILRDFYVRKNC